MSDLEEHVARAIFDASTAKARETSRHVATWETLPPYWREVHMNSARAAIVAMREAEQPTLFGVPS